MVQMVSENLVLAEIEFKEFQRFCRSKGFDLCYFSPEISGSEEYIRGLQFDSPRVLKVKTRRFTSSAIPYDVAEWQCDKWGTALLQLRDEFSAGRSAVKPQVSELRDVGKQLSDQLKTAFISVLLVLWIPALNLSGGATPTRGPWLPWVIASIILFSWFVYRRKRVRQPKFRWGYPFVAVIALWLMYFISGFSLPNWSFAILAAVLSLWTICLLITLLLIMARMLPEGKPVKATRRFAAVGEAISWPLTVLVLLTSVLLGWTRLWNTGMRGWWMDPLLYLGTLIFIVVAMYSIPHVDSSQGQPNP
jgi:hypothetical protein